MYCFICRGVVRAHVVGALKSPNGDRGWSTLCVPCAMRHGVDGILVARPEDRELANRWKEYRAAPPVRRSPAA